MAGKPKSSNPVPVSDVASAILDPVLRKRAGISIELIQSWDEIVGSRLAPATRPERIVWPRRMSDADPFEPATLVIACDGSAALHVQHQTGEIVGRVNAFLGFNAIGRIRIVQKRVADAVRHKPTLRQLSADEESKIAGTVTPIDDDGLREALQRLGRSVTASRK
jgi:hypothetical protein